MITTGDTLSALEQFQAAPVSVIIRSEDVVATKEKEDEWAMTGSSMVRSSRGITYLGREWEVVWLP